MYNWNNDIRGLLSEPQMPEEVRVEAAPIPKAMPQAPQSEGIGIGDVLKGIAYGFVPNTMSAIEQSRTSRELRKRLAQAPQIGTGSDRNMTYQALMQRADILESMGDVESADTMRQRALQFSPTPIYATSTFNAQAPDGSIVRRATSQTGEIMDFGNVSASPDTLANIGSARSAERARAGLTQIQNAGRIAVANINASGKSPAGRPSSGSTGIPKPVKTTEDERKAAGWLQQARKAYMDMVDVYSQDPSAASPGLIEQYGQIDELKNRARSPGRQRYVQAASAFAEATLRAATGAGVTRDEAQQKINELTPQRGDSEDVIKQKMASQEVYLQSLEARAGGAKLAPPNPTEQPKFSRSAYNDYTSARAQAYNMGNYDLVRKMDQKALDMGLILAIPRRK